MEIGNRKQFCFSIFNPPGCIQRLTFGAVSVSAGIVGNILMAAVVTPQHVAAEHLSAAGSDLLDNHVLLGVEQRKFMSVEAKNIRHFYSTDS